jgi:alkylation response protein AidB-like acyl-CoA dehydrogenase
MTSVTTYQDAITRVIEHEVGPEAQSYDETGTFPRASIDAVAEAGLLGLCSATEVGGGGQGLRAAAEVVEGLATACASTAMIVTMHFSGTAALEAAGPDAVRREVAAGRHLTTLAFSETGSRSHFWAPVSTATADGERVRLDARKSWVTSAGEADSYVWSSRPVAAEGPMTLWSVPAGTLGLTVVGDFDGLGLRANASSPMNADEVTVPIGNRIGDDGAGLDLALSAILPWFLVCSASMSLGLMRATIAETIGHVTVTRFEHLDQSLAQQPGTRADVARMQLLADTTETVISDALTAIEAGRDDATLRVLEVKAVAGEAAIAVTDLAMKVCGGAAYRKELGIERRFRDARAARVMAPTTDALLDFVGRALTGLPLLGDV